MGFRFRRRLRIMPGVRLNLTKSGVSTSIGGHGATVNLSKQGTRTTVGLPGSGLSYRSPTRPLRALTATPSGIGSLVIALIVVAIIGFLLLAR